ncbi:hypothetical protein AB5I41_05205 [Sphingomonas sp. MMS24-JH45]
MRALLVLALVATPATAQTGCLTAPEAEAMQVALPDIIRDAGRVCATLPPTSLLRRPSGAFIAKYEAEADRAWPAARTALRKLSDPAVAPLLDSNFARPLITSLVAPQVTGQFGRRRTARPSTGSSHCWSRCRRRTQRGSSSPRCNI